MTYEPIPLEQLLQHRSWAIHVARQLVHDDEAEELVQRTWITALRRPPERERGLRSWIRTVILNLAREGRRRESARRLHETAVPQDVREALDPLETLSQKESHELLARRLAALSEPYRTTVVLRYYEGLSSVEIARRLRVPDGTVRWRLKVGLDLLRSDLERTNRGDRTRWLAGLLALSREEPTAERTAPEPMRLAPWRWILPGAGLGAAAALMLLHSPTEGRAPLWEPEHAGIALVAGPAEQRSSAEKRASALASAPSVATAATEADAAVLPRLAVRVVDGKGRAVGGARVLVYAGTDFEERARTDEQGSVELRPRAADVGALPLVGTADHIALRALADGFASPEVLHVGVPYAPDHEALLVLGGPELVLQGRVVDAGSRPIAGALLSWVDIRALASDPAGGDISSPFYLSARSSSDGAFELRHVPQGSRALYCSADGFASEWAVFDGAPWLEVRLLRGARVSGTVRGADGLAVAGAEVAFEPLYEAPDWTVGLPGFDALRRGFSERTRTGADGTFALDGVHAGKRRIWASDASTGRSATTTIELAEGTDEVWEPWIELRDGLRLRLVDAAGHPLAGWHVEFRRPKRPTGRWMRRLSADAEGRLHLLEVDGNACLEVLDPTGLGAPYLARTGLRPGPAETTLTVDTSTSTEISGTLVDASGAPMDGGQLVLHSRLSGPNVRLARDEEGRFAQRLSPGDRRLVLMFPFSATMLAQVSIAAGESRELGLVSAPPTGTLRIRSPGARPEQRFTLHALLGDDAWHTWVDVGNGPLAGEPCFPVFPGRYNVIYADARGTAPRSVEVEVRPHAETVAQLPMQ